MMEKVGQYKKTLESVQRDHATAQKEAEEEQNTLLCGTGQNNYGEANANQRGRLVAANERLDRGTGRIRHAMEVSLHAKVNIQMETADPLQQASIAWLVAHSFAQPFASAIRHPLF